MGGGVDGEALGSRLELVDQQRRLVAGCVHGRQLGPHRAFRCPLFPQPTLPPTYPVSHREWHWFLKILQVQGPVHVIQFIPLFHRHPGKTKIPAFQNNLKTKLITSLLHSSFIPPISVYSRNSFC